MTLSIKAMLKQEVSAMDILSIPDLSLSECLEIVNEQFDCQAIAETLIDEASGIGFRVREQTDLSAEISHNLARFYSLSRRYFRMPRAARAFLKAFPPD